MNYKEVTILLVEDDDVDILATKKALRQLKIANPLVEARDGLIALEILRSLHAEKQTAPPVIVLLDLNMPRMGGLEFLETIRNDISLKHLIVFVMSTSEADADIWAAYEQNIAGYIVKSNAGKGFTDAMEMLEHYWRIIELPGKTYKSPPNQ